MISKLYDTSAWLILIMAILTFGFFFGLFIIGYVGYLITYWFIYKLIRFWKTIKEGYTTRI